MAARLLKLLCAHRAVGKNAIPGPRWLWRASCPLVTANRPLMTSPSSHKAQSHLESLKSRGLYNQTLVDHVNGSKPVSLQAVEDGRYVDVLWEDGHRSRFHSVWLRHSCHCPDCRLDNNAMITIDFRSVGDEVRVTQVSLEGDEVAVFTWEEGGTRHVGPIPTAWLRQYCYSPRAEAERREQRAMKFFQDKTIPEVQYQDVMTSDSGLYQWLVHLSERGICLVKGVPTESGQVARVAERIAPLQHTVYGEVFDVVNTPEAVNAAYSAEQLRLHMDQIHYEAPPGLQFLHCIQFDPHIVGGDSTFADVHETAQRLRRERPDYFQTLARVPITAQTVHYDREYPVHIRTQRPILTLNHKEELVSVVWHPMLEGPLMADFAAVEPFYKAYRHFFSMVNAEEHMYSLRLTPGDLVSFNNRRVLHGRASYLNQRGARWLQGTYVESSEFQSRVQVMHNLVGDGRPVCRVGNSSWE